MNLSAPQGLAQVRSVAANDAMLVRAWRCATCQHRALGERPLRCLFCGRSNSYELAGVTDAEGRGAPVWRWASNVDPEPIDRLETPSLPGWQHVTGGLVSGSVALLEGARGSGKSTLAMVLASEVAPAVVACLEIREATARRYLEEQSRDTTGIALTTSGELAELARVVKATGARLLVVDSYKFLSINGRRATSRSDAERQVALALPTMAVELNVAILAIVHMRSGDPKKPSCGAPPLQHCDAIFRIVGGVLECDDKNRFGPDRHRARFARSEDGRLDGGTPL